MGGGGGGKWLPCVTRIIRPFSPFPPRLIQLRPSCDSPFVPLQFFSSAALLRPLNLHPDWEPN